MLGIIGGSGFYSLEGFGEPRTENLATDYSTEPVPVEIHATPVGEVAFIPRHGKNHRTPPHQINYRANIAALASLGVTELIGVNAVGGIHAQAGPGAIIVPTQIIDYTWGRASSFCDGGRGELLHIDFTHPFSAVLSQRVLTALDEVMKPMKNRHPVLTPATYGCTQGPRLETAAEIQRLRRDGCDIVGMTAMPEVALAREKSMDYCMLALSVNWAAGIVPGTITMEEIMAVLNEGAGRLQRVIGRLLSDA